MNDEPTSRHADPGQIAAAIRAGALGALLAGGICLFFGFQWLIDAPGSASEQATPVWFAIDHVFQWALRVIGVAFLVVAGLAALGRRSAALLETAVESAFTVLMLAMAIETFAEARADGHFDSTVILLLILAALGYSAARRSWRLCRQIGGQPTGDDRPA